MMVDPVGQIVSDNVLATKSTVVNVVTNVSLSGLASATPLGIEVHTRIVFRPAARFALPITTVSIN
ncbi:hypothetical protein D3C72_889170 [compost metagenome]